MDRKSDPQARDEASRQRAHDPGPPADARRPDRGVLRDDGGPRPAGEGEDALDRDETPVIDPADPRHPPPPDTMGADTGPKPGQPAGDDPKPDATRRRAGRG